MTDLDKFVELYKSFGIDCKVIVRNPNKHFERKVIYLSTMGGEEETISDKLVGYGGFGSEIIFDMDGKFLEQGFYEW